jgi:hypothetical protein
MQTVGDQGQRSEQCAADDLRDHHDATQHDDRPGPARGLVVVFS